ncbi:MAG: pyridoxal phosphate-dependent aminotransferase [Bacteroidales bacterium]|jgi:aspartate/methionine/tyrosine aminotransferase|nr:pyridoxal phosphate-dependent aminotransferase [Bacteroidales bacterium]
MVHTPISLELVEKSIKNIGLQNFEHATIREIVGLVNILEKESGEKYIRMEMGVPGLAAPEIGINAEISALKRGVASDYPMVDGVSELKNEASRFIKKFVGIDIKPESCIPTVGSMQGGYGLFLLCGNLDKNKDTALFIDPGFPVQKQQFNVLNLKYDSFDVYEFRGKKLEQKLEKYLSKGNINSIIYSNPNNPSWVCLTDEELRIIGKLATKYDVIVIEDLAYFAMDFRKNSYHPGKAPYQVSVSNYTDNYILMISASKAFSYAGQRIAVVAISDKIYNRSYPNLLNRFGAEKFGYTFVLRIIYALSSGVCHSAQYGMAAMLKAASDGNYDFIEDISEYAKKAKIMKKLFLDAGFKIVYDKDIDENIADGFYFTIAYENFNGAELLKELLCYGISAITLYDTGSTKNEGLRACVSQVKREQFLDLEKRLQIFKENHKNS